jgi:hypothetical protein
MRFAIVATLSSKVPLRLIIVLQFILNEVEGWLFIHQ